MLKLEFRKKYCSNGLIDDFVLYGTAKDYLDFTNSVDLVLSSFKNKIIVKTTNYIYIEISLDNSINELFTSLQNKDNEYFSYHEWENRDILRVMGSEKVLIELKKFLIDLSKKEQGYSYLSEYSKVCKYSSYSPEWRLHI